MRISAADAVDLFVLPRREILCPIKAPTALQQSLPVQYFMEPRDAALKIVNWIEQSRIGIRYLVRQS